MVEDRSFVAMISPFIPLLPALLIPGVGALVSVASVAILLALLKTARRPTLALIDHSGLRSVCIGIVAGTVIQAALYFVIEPGFGRITGEPLDLSSFAGVQGNVPAYLQLLALGLLFGGIVEELVFRGFVVGWGSVALGERWQYALAGLSAAVFGVAHWYQGLTGVASTGLTGLALGLIYIRCGRKLLPAIVTHMTINAIGITMIFFGLY